jgi:hypothetical protein
LLAVGLTLAGAAAFVALAWLVLRWLQSLLSSEPDESKKP